MNETCSESLFTNENIEDILPPKWKYKVLSKIKFGDPFIIEYSLKVALFSQEDVEEWIDALQKRTHCNYSIVHTRKVAGEKLIFKRYFYCQHRTRSKDTYPSKWGTKNTNCPSKLIISLHRVGNNKYHSKGKPPPDPKMPCIIDYVLTHNHSVQLAQKFRKVSTDVNKILLDLFAKGHSATTAYEIIRIGARINNPDNYEEVLDDRSVCPDRNYCHKWFNEFKKQHGEVDKTGRTFMSNRLEEYNSEVGDECAKLDWMDKDNYAVALCSPLSKRVHKYIKSSSEVVFMAAINPAGNEGRKAFFLMSPSECGALPIGIVITSSETAGLIQLGLQLLKNLVGEMFFGAKKGPKVFIVDDCEAGQIALSAVWPKSRILFCSLHVIHTLWRYLLCSKNGINQEDHLKLFNQFRKIMYADTEEECIDCYTEARISAESYPNYLQILKAYWEKRHLWAACYRTKLLDKFQKNSLEKSMCILREPIFHRMRSFDVIQLTDFLLTKFDDFFSLRLLDAANRRTIRDLTKKPPLPKNIQVEQINSYLFLVPSLKVSHVKYHVNIEIVACTCLKYTTGYICNHIGWILSLFSTPQEKINNLHVRETFYKVATGQDSVEDNFIFTDEDFEEDNDEKTEDNLLEEDIYIKIEDNDEYNPEDSVQDTVMETENVHLSQSENSESKIVEESLIIAGNEVIRLQIVKEQAESGSKLTALPNVLPGVVVRSITTDHEAFEIGQKLNTQLFDKFESFLKVSPMTVAPALQQMINKTKSLTCLEDFLLACKTFSERKP